MYNFVNLGAGRCVLAREVIGLCAASKMKASLDPKAVVFDLCDGTPAKTIVFCRNNTVFLSNFAYSTLKARLAKMSSEDPEDEDAGEVD